MAVSSVADNPTLTRERPEPTARYIYHFAAAGTSPHRRGLTAGSTLLAPVTERLPIVHTDPRKVPGPFTRRKCTGLTAVRRIPVRPYYRRKWVGGRLRASDDPQGERGVSVDWSQPYSMSRDGNAQAVPELNGAYQRWWGNQNNFFISLINRMNWKRVSNTCSTVSFFFLLLNIFFYTPFIYIYFFF